MSKKNNYNTKENGHALACPHCGAGTDRVTVGLSWDFNDHCWRCVICGYRGYEHSIKPRGKAEIVAESIWDQVLDALDKENSEQTILDRHRCSDNVHCLSFGCFL